MVKKIFIQRSGGVIILKGLINVSNSIIDSHGRIASDLKVYGGGAKDFNTEPKIIWC